MKSMLSYSMVTFRTPYTGYIPLAQTALPSSAPYKAALNRTISENILRKSGQLVADLESLRGQKPRSLNDLLTSSASHATKTLQENQIKTAIESILRIRKSLGIEKPAGTIDGLEKLRQYSENRGSVLNVKS